MTAMETYRIGIIADTHNRWAPQVATLFEGVDEIWHLGDVCEESILDELRLISPNVVTILGNNDFQLNYPLVRNLERRGERFHLVHIPPRLMPVKAETDWVLFGHTHRPLNVVEAGVHIFNPGSAGKANKGAPASVGQLTARGKEPFSAEIILL